MPGCKTQFRRLQLIDLAVRQGNYPNCATLSEELEVSPKTIQRDIDFLRDQRNVPIEYDPVKHGFYYSEPNYRLPAIDISESDLFAVSIAEKVLQQYQNTPLFDRLKKVFEKITLCLPERVTISPSWVDLRVSHFSDAPATINPGVFETLFNALKESKTVEIYHQSPSQHKPIRRQVDPYHCISFHGEWYMAGFCHRKATVLTFAFSRIKEAKTTGGTFTIPLDFSFKQYAEGHFAMFRGGKPRTVKIAFKPFFAQIIKDRKWHDSQTIRQRKDGSIILSMKVSNLTGVKWWVLSWGSGAKVLSPKKLVEDIKNELKTMAEAYQHPAPGMAARSK